MIKRFTLADYISTLRLGKRNRQIYFSLYDYGDNKTQKAKQLFGWKKFPFDNETIKLLLKTMTSILLRLITKTILIKDGMKQNIQILM